MSELEEATRDMNNILSEWTAPIPLGPEHDLLTKIITMLLFAAKTGRLMLVNIDQASEFVANMVNAAYHIGIEKGRQEP